MAELRWGAASDTGRVRDANEDNLFAGSTLFVVADGMGGHQAGEIASQITVDRLESGLTADTPTLSDLVAAIGHANRDIFDAAIENPEQQGMGTTVTSLAVMDDPDDGEVFALANVGDSRTYVLRNGRLRQLTIDHSYVQELVAEGHISRDEARHHPRRNIVTRALGIERSIRIDSWTLAIVRGDRFVLCSDGLVDEVHDDEITDILQANDDPQAAADALVAAANDHGGRDNVTVVVVDVLEGDDPPDPTEEIDVIPAWAPKDDQDDTGDIDAGPAGIDAAGIDADGIDIGDIPTAPPPVGVDADPPELFVSPDAAGDDPPGPGGSQAPPSDPDADPTWLLADPNAVAPPDGADVIDTVTTTVADADGSDPGPPRPRRRRIARFALVVGVAAIAVTGFAIFSAWARAGYFVAFDDGDQVVIYRGRSDAVLWFDATVEAPTPLARDLLDERSIELVEDERRFSSLRSAEIFVTDRLTPTTTTTTTTLPPTTTEDEAGNETGIDDDAGSETGITTGS